MIAAAAVPRTIQIKVRGAEKSVLLLYRAEHRVRMGGGGGGARGVSAPCGTSGADTDPPPHPSILLRKYFGIFFF